MSRNSRRSTPTLNDLGVAYRLLGDEPVGGGRFYWLRVRPTHREVRVSNGKVKLSLVESHRVSSLVCKNPTPRPVVILEGTVVVGGLQNRIVERTVVIPPKAVVVIPVKCVEAGRWSARRGRREFFQRGRAARRLRQELKRSKFRSHRAGGPWTARQDEVWDSVYQECRRYEVFSCTEDYGEVLDFLQQSISPEDLPDLEPPAGANAVMVTLGRFPVWFEVFPRPRNLRPILQDLVLDVLSVAEEPVESRDSVPRPEEVLEKLFHLPLESVEGVPNTPGETLVVACEDWIGEAVFLEDRLVHASFLHVLVN